MHTSVSCNFDGHCGKLQPHCNGRCCSHCIMLADVIPGFVTDAITTLCCVCVSDGNPLWQMLKPGVLSKWQMLFQQVTDGIAT